jgi:sigma-B regulation protein RsbU (phosphoserine phosphatase)
MQLGNTQSEQDNEGHAPDLTNANRLTRHSDWQKRLYEVTEMMREMSSQTDPQEMVNQYSERMRQMFPVQAFVSISRRGIESPGFMVTRASVWESELDPWLNRDKLPVYESGLLQRLLYAGEPAYIPNPKYDHDDPAIKYLGESRLLICIPSFDDGEALNTVVMGIDDPGSFDPVDLPDMVWRTNLFGRATNTLVLKRELDKAYDIVDQELKTVAQIQRSLLPEKLPDIPTLDIAAHYETSARAGGDYYDIFQLDEGKWGFLIADVCGHGTPAAVLMAIMHALAHTIPGHVIQPSELLSYVNDKLAEHYTSDGNFITAFYSIYDPSDRTLTYASAGHNPPRVKRCSDGSMFVLDQAQSIPLGIVPKNKYEQHTVQLLQGDQVVLYTDGITEAFNDDEDLYGTDRLDGVLEHCGIDALALIETVLESVENFTKGRPADDDRTLLVLKVR